MQPDGKPSSVACCLHERAQWCWVQISPNALCAAAHLYCVGASGPLLIVSCLLLLAGSSWTSPPTPLRATPLITACPSSAMAMSLPCTVCCGTIRRELASTCQAAGQFIRHAETTAKILLLIFFLYCIWSESVRMIEVHLFGSVQKTKWNLVLKLKFLSYGCFNCIKFGYKISDTFLTP